MHAFGQTVGLRRVAAAMICAAVAGLGIAGCGTDHSRSDSSESAGAELRHAADIADHLSTAAGYPFATSLANELHLSDPKTVYEPLTSPAQTASKGAIGVYTTGTTLWLSKRGPGNLVTQLRRVNGGPARGTYGPEAATPSGLVNGDFATPLSETWSIQPGRIARVTRDPHVFSRTPASLRVDGRGGRNRVPSLVFQTPERLVSHAAGTVYTVDLLARTMRLSRPLSVETKLDYRDGTYEFFFATPQGPSQPAGGVPAGTSRGWIPLESRAVAKKPVQRLTFYAVDTGSAPLKGSAWIDDVTLAVTKP
jgi:hypothetical protein